MNECERESSELDSREPESESQLGVGSGSSRRVSEAIYARPCLQSLGSVKTTQLRRSCSVAQCLFTNCDHRPIVTEWWQRDNVETITSWRLSRDWESVPFDQVRQYAIRSNSPATSKWLGRLIFDYVRVRDWWSVICCREVSKFKFVDELW